MGNGSSLYKMSEELDREDIKSEDIEMIDETPVISLEEALVLYREVVKHFPQWEKLLALPCDARVEETRVVFVEQIWTISKFLDTQSRKKRMKKACKLPGECDFGFWDVPVPCPDELRSVFREGKFSRYLLELELASIRMDLRKTMQPILALLSGTVETDPESESVLRFKANLFDLMEKIGIYCDN